MADRPEVVLPQVPSRLQQGMRAAIDADGAAERRAVAALVGSDPTFLAGWARLAELTEDAIERYAYARVGYHRGLDALRAAGWGGVGRVRWQHHSNRGFLRCLAHLRDAAATIGETDEVERIDAFLRDLDPDWDDTWVAG